MKTALFVLSMGALLCVSGSGAAQQKPVAKSLAQLELTMEVATTSEEGYPSTVRITVRNVGALPVDMPMPESPCVAGGGGSGSAFSVAPADPKEHTWLPGFGTMCGMDHFPTLQWRVENEWIRLRPGEWAEVTVNIRNKFRNQKREVMEIWTEYIPPEVKSEELAALDQSGYIIPTKKIQAEHRSFNIR